MGDVLKLQQSWESTYASASTPFDSPEPDQWISDLESCQRVKGNVLDAGCGPGRNSIYLSRLGYQVSGLDISTNAIERAKRNAAARGSTARFEQANIFTLSGYDNRFDTVVDIGCFHSLYDDADRASYAVNLYRVCRSGAVIFLRAFSDRNPKAERWHDHSPALREEQIRNAFARTGWAIKELAEREIDLWISSETTLKAYCWFAEIDHP